jgi:predicted ATP-dependent serine protease
MGKQKNLKPLASAEVPSNLSKLVLPTDSGLAVKVRSACHFCGHPFPHMRERCPSCLCWRPYDSNPMGSLAKKDGSLDDDQTILLSNVKAETIPRIRTNLCDEIFGPDHSPGIVITSVNLLGGERGAGKSTLSLKLADKVAPRLKDNREVLYICAEQGKEELLTHAKRIEVKHMDRIRIYPMGADADLSKIIIARKPGFIFVDSLQALVPDMLMATDFARGIKDFCVEIKAPCILISTLNKGGDLEGLEKLQHVVDSVATLFSTGRGEERILSNSKNRNGPANRELFFEMTEQGLRKIKTPRKDEDDE